MFNYLAVFQLQSLSFCSSVAVVGIRQGGLVVVQVFYSQQKGSGFERGFWVQGMNQKSFYVA